MYGSDYETDFLVSHFIKQRQPQQAIARPFGDVHTAICPAISDPGGRGMERDVMKYGHDTLILQMRGQLRPLLDGAGQNIEYVAIELAVFQNAG